MNCFMIFKMFSTLILSLLLMLTDTLNAVEVSPNLNSLSEKQNAVNIHKCCEHDQLIIDSSCRLARDYNQSVWIPQFKDAAGNNIIIKYYNYVNGLPDCNNTELRAIYDLGEMEDELNLLYSGRLLHLIHHKNDETVTNEEVIQSHTISIHDTVVPEEKETVSFIHDQKKYCMDKVYIPKKNKTGIYAKVCVPDVTANWRDVNFLIKKVLNAIFHAIAMVLYLIVAIIYFVLPTLRDLAGNIITTINICLIVSQAADLVRIFTELSNHVSFMIADIILYISLLSAFFWLNSLGFYVWKTFKSRNVFLRVTDVRKYCYYSLVVWSCVAVMAALAICAHFLLDTGTNPRRKTKTQFSSSIIANDIEQETIGWLGIAIFFTPVAFTILFNIFFYVTTLKVVKRITIYSAFLHYKLKGCFDLFLQLFLIMTTAWLFLLLSWQNMDGLIYAHVVMNMLQAILVFYVCVVRQSHVTTVLRKSCCNAQPVPTNEWGDEMIHMNGGY